MKPKKKSQFVRTEDFATFGLMHHRSNLNQLAEVRALRQLMLEHIAQVLAVQELGSISEKTADERTRLERKFVTELEARVERLQKQILQSFLEQLEDESPEMATWFDARDQKDVDDAV
jgi:hypothetical protein